MLSSGVVQIFITDPMSRMSATMMEKDFCSGRLPCSDITSCNHKAISSYDVSFSHILLSTAQYYSVYIQYEDVADTTTVGFLTR